MHYNSLRGLILEGNNLYKIDISDYVKFMVYDIDINPTLAYVPETIFKEIEDCIIKNDVARGKEESEIKTDALEEKENKYEDNKRNTGN